MYNVYLQHWKLVTESITLAGYIVSTLSRKIHNYGRKNVAHTSCGYKAMYRHIKVVSSCKQVAFMQSLKFIGATRTWNCANIALAYSLTLLNFVCKKSGWTVKPFDHENVFSQDRVSNLSLIQQLTVNPVRNSKVFVEMSIMAGFAVCHWKSVPGHIEIILILWAVMLKNEDRARECWALLCPPAVTPTVNMGQYTVTWRRYARVGQYRL